MRLRPRWLQKQSDQQRALLDGLHHRRRHQVECAHGDVLISAPHAQVWFRPRATWRQIRVPETAAARRNFLSRGNVGGAGVLAQLQGADVGHDGPAVPGRNLRCVVGHGAEAVGDHVEEVSQRRLAQALDVVGGGLRGKPRDGSRRCHRPRGSDTAHSKCRNAVVREPGLPRSPGKACSRRDCCLFFRYRDRYLRATRRGPPCLRPEDAPSAGRG